MTPRASARSPTDSVPGDGNSQGVTGFYKGLKVQSYRLWRLITRQSGLWKPTEDRPEVHFAKQFDKLLRSELSEAN